MVLRWWCFFFFIANVHLHAMPHVKYTKSCDTIQIIYCESQNEAESNEKKKEMIQAHSNIHIHKIKTFAITIIGMVMEKKEEDRTVSFSICMAVETSRPTRWLYLHAALAARMIAKAYAMISISFFFYPLHCLFGMAFCHPLCVALQKAEKWEGKCSKQAANRMKQRGEQKTMPNDICALIIFSSSSFLKKKMKKRLPGQREKLNKNKAALLVWQHFVFRLNYISLFSFYYYYYFLSFSSFAVVDVVILMFAVLPLGCVGFHSALRHSLFCFHSQCSVSNAINLPFHCPSEMRKISVFVGRGLLKIWVAVIPLQVHTSWLCKMFVCFFDFLSSFFSFSFFAVPFIKNKRKWKQEKMCVL